LPKKETIIKELKNIQAQIEDLEIEEGDEETENHLSDAVIAIQFAITSVNRFEPEEETE